MRDAAMRAKSKVRLWVIGPLLFYLLIFLLWFPRWQHAPQSYSARLLGGLFITLTAMWAVPMIVGVLWYGSWGRPGLRDVVQLVTEIYETFLKKDSSSSTPAISNKSVLRAAALNRPSLVISKQLKDGTPVRGHCPLCEVEFSTEAFGKDRSYPHEARLDKWYREHFEEHIAAGDLT
jgi:hypothetical protein